MSPNPFHAKKEQYDGGSYDPTPVKTTKGSNFLQCLPPSSTDEPKTKPQDQPPPRPLIIYTHSPKVIHTQPRDFMALVQKLTGYTRPPDDAKPTQDPRLQQCHGSVEDNESTSVVTEEHGSSANDVSHVTTNSCFVDGRVGVGSHRYRAAGFDPFFNPAPVFPAAPTNFLCASTHQLPFYSPDSLFLNRNSLGSSSSSLRVLKDYGEM
ncbi:hypothetical protein R6Q59_013463 [Mikania micrantha]|uniref:VQ domain-containing protein n=1 Tax=Mikania micrantha TaxID=192012 RepID=A0A5N6P405_9ASTR|nr:hypothetical protein E3N88_11801 [Mikania micrantha]